MTARVFVDINIFVYARQADEILKQPIATRWLDRLWKEQCGRTSMQVVNEYYVTITRKIKPALQSDEAWDRISSLFEWNPHQTRCIRHASGVFHNSQRDHAVPTTGSTAAFIFGE